MAGAVGFNTASFILILVAFVFLLLATISSPVVSTFRLATTNDYYYGIFGYCEIGGSCSKAAYPLTLSAIDTRVAWMFARSTRDTLAKIFILAPIALGFNFFTLVAVGITHFLLSPVIFVALVLNIISFIATTIICIIVILVFHPQVSWTGWILVGAAAANLISLILLFVCLKFQYLDQSDDDDDEEDSTFANDTNNKFDDKFANYNKPANAFTAPLVGGYSAVTKVDDASSVSRDYEFKAAKPGVIAVATNEKSLSNSSIYNTNPQLATDFTQHSKPSSSSVVRTGSSNSFYEDANARPPQQQQQQPLNRAPYNPTNYSVFEHHPEVEGHKPFTELPDDDDHNNNTHQQQRSVELDSDNDSNFTSVSQRAPNPNYYGPNNQNPAGPGYNQNQYPNSSPYQPQFQFQSQPPPQQRQYAPQHQQPGFYASPQYQPAPQGYYNLPVPPPQNRGPTVADQVLNNNPDFALGGGARRKYGGPVRPGMGMGPGGMPNSASFNRRNNPYGMR